MTQDEYNKKFGIDISNEPTINADAKLFRAFEKAHDIRKFEIELYWKRTAYFWTLIAAIFTGYFLLLTTETAKLPQKEFYLILVASIGLAFSFGWFLAAKGSKFWQENWEGHLDLLEDKITGPLYKTVLMDREPAKRLTASSAPFSVTKINHWIAVMVIFIWFILLLTPLVKQILPILTIIKNITGIKMIVIIFFEMAIIICTFIFIRQMYLKTRTKFKSKPDIRNVKAIDREATLDK